MDRAIGKNQGIDDAGNAPRPGSGRGRAPTPDRLRCPRRRCPMFYTHHFSHSETLSRAKSWLARLGYQPRQIPTTDPEGVDRIAVTCSPTELAGVHMLISAVEASDPD